MSPLPYSGAQIRASLVAYSIGKAISAPLSLLLILLLASVMQRTEYASYIAATAVLEICVVLGTFGVEWVMQTSLAAIRVHGNGLQLRRAVFRLGAVPFVSYGLLGTALWMQADRVSELLCGVAAPDLLRVYAVVLMLEGPARILRDSLMAVLLLQRIGQVSLVVRVVAVFVMVAAVLLTGHTLDAITLGRIEIAAAAIGLLIALIMTTMRTVAATGKVIPLLSGIVFVAVLIPTTLSPPAGVSLQAAVGVGLVANAVILAVLLAGYALFLRLRRR